MTSVIEDILPQSIDSKTIFTLEKVVLADRNIPQGVIGQALNPVFRIGGMELRLFIYDDSTPNPKYQLVLTNFNGKLIWFGGLVSSPSYGWYAITHIINQREVIDYIIHHPGVHDCIRDLMCLIPDNNEPSNPCASIPQRYMGSGSAMQRKFYGKAYCGDALTRKIRKWI